MTDISVAEHNRALVLHGFREFAAGNIEVLRPLLREDFVEHSPGNPSGRDAFMEWIAAAPVAGAALELKRVVADDEYVVVHYRMVTPEDERGTAVIDIWRLVDGRIAEHWDVVQPVPEPSTTPNGMF
ncbi:nuclear transport factor 2 family protein [Dactylosporangium sp. NPDC049140]|uniref:nuclear transport factor 2 family protein n=1 Tax=Dactylosporangium sp. NPDC049140 TaxID=3155647 RepID=UPI0033F051CC